MPGPGFLMSPTLPRGGPQINWVSTRLAASGASFNSVSFNFAREAGPRPAGSLIRSWLTEVGSRKAFSVG